MGRTAAALRPGGIISLAAPDVMAIAVARGSFVIVAASEPGAEVARPSSTTSTATTAVSEPINPPAAPTPVGVFRIERVIDGVRQAPPGTLYRPWCLPEGFCHPRVLLNPGLRRLPPVGPGVQPGDVDGLVDRPGPVTTAVRVYQ